MPSKVPMQIIITSCIYSFREVGMLTRIAHCNPGHFLGTECFMQDGINLEDPHRRYLVSRELYPATVPS